MNIRTGIVCFFFVLMSLAVMKGLGDDNPYFAISEQDVVLHVPNGFPKPNYDFTHNKLTPTGFLLGRKLFYDPILSKDYMTSCASCHQRIAAFAHIDHALSHAGAGQIGKRNVPALQNLIWNNAFMADGGINHLDLQPIAPITSPLEMGETLAGVLVKLQQDSVYPGMFRNAFGDSVVTSERLLKALSQFLSLMISADSRYDRYMRNTDTLSAPELHGLKVFRLHCARCHTEPLFTDNSYRNIGLEPDPSLKDSGRALITQSPDDMYKFRVPSLRNVEMTYPYMHDGRFRTLALVLNHYTGKKFASTTRDRGLDSLTVLTVTDKDDLIAFLKTLTDRTFLYDRRFADPNFR